MKRTLFLVFALVCIAGASPAFSRDSLGMRLLGQTLLGPARQVVVQGNYAYVGVSCGLLILDVSDPANPVEMGRAYDVNFSIIEDIFVQNGYAYFVDAYNGLAIVDVRDVRNPRVVGRARCGYSMRGISVMDTLAYVVGSGGVQDSSDLFVINVKDPAAPFVVAGYDTWGEEKIQVVDSLAFATGGVYLNVYSVANPRAVYRVVQYSGIGTSRDLSIKDTLCFVVSQDSGLVVLNIRDPLNPIKLGRCKPNGLRMRVSVLGNYAYLCHDLNLYGDYPYSNISNFWVIDVSDPVNPFQAGRYESSGAGGDIFPKDSLVYFADGGKGLRVMDVRNPSQPREITHYSTGDVCWELVKQGNYLYVAHGGDGLRVLDVSNPAQPVEVGHLEMPWRTFDIVVKDSLLYAAEGDSGLVVVDIRNPAQPAVIGRWAGLQTGVAYGVFVQDTLAYLCGEFWGNLWVVNVADPRNPYYVGGWGSPVSSLHDLWVRGRYAYAPDGPPWPFHVFDVSNPRIINDFPWDGLAPGLRVEFRDTLGVVLAIDGIVYLISIGDSVRPYVLGMYKRPTGDDNGYGIHYFAPGYVWVGWNTYYYRIPESCGRMDLLDARDPRLPRSIRHYETGWTISDVWGEDLNYAYGGGYLGDLYIFKVDSSVGVEQSGPSRIASRGPEVVISPNPVRGSCLIRYWSGKEGNVRLSLYDLTGRVVRSFTPYASSKRSEDPDLSGRLTPYEVYWDGRDGQGKEVRSGVYFLRVEGGGQAITRKLVVVR